MGVGLKTGRGYDCVAESLYRIQNRLNRGKQRRDGQLQTKVSKLSRYHSDLSDCKEQWDQSVHDEKERNLHKNCQKAELGEKKKRVKAQRQNQAASRLTQSNLDKLNRFKAGNEMMADNLKRYQGQVTRTHQKQTSNASQARKLLNEHNEQRREENQLRHYGATANRYKEDVKFDNFKRHTVQRHVQ